MQIATLTLGLSDRFCELPDGRIVNYIDLGNGYIAIPGDAMNQAQSATGFAVGAIATGTTMPTRDKFGGLGGGGASGPVTSTASYYLRALTMSARLDLLQSFTRTRSVGGSLARILRVLGVLESFLSFLNTTDAYQNAPICKPIA